MAHTFFWHDYETFGAQPRYDRPAQFAGIRTDDQLNEIGEPVMWYCQPANDYLPDPQSCLITGITPQRALQEGVAEHEFAALIEAELAQAGTVGVGYNTIRFDDEITRFMFWRNLIDPMRASGRTAAAAGICWTWCAWSMRCAPTAFSGRPRKTARPASSSRTWPAPMACCTSRPTMR
jgi:exonuclease I